MQRHKYPEPETETGDRDGRQRDKHRSRDTRKAGEIRNSSGTAEGQIRERLDGNS